MERAITLLSLTPQGTQDPIKGVKKALTSDLIFSGAFYKAGPLSFRKKSSFSSYYMSI